MKNNVKISNLQELIEAVHKYNLSEDIIEDVKARIDTWEKNNEPNKELYTQQQFDFVEVFINMFK
ncbi:hypothetical protein Q3304_09000 [Clostridioides sp. GD02377]|uniref:hypothetical protein n=1 Tax=unclassified Clostridioides TaxID=2635829 RepID=UPI0038A25169